MFVLKFALISSESLKKAFPLKNELDLDDLVNTAQAELENNGGSLAYQKLFIEVTCAT